LRRVDHLPCLSWCQTQGGRDFLNPSPDFSLQDTCVSVFLPLILPFPPPISELVRIIAPSGVESPSYLILFPWGALLASFQPPSSFGSHQYPDLILPSCSFRMVLIPSGFLPLILPPAIFWRLLLPIRLPVQYFGPPDSFSDRARVSSMSFDDSLPFSWWHTFRALSLIRFWLRRSLLSFASFPQVMLS